MKKIKFSELSLDEKIGQLIIAKPKKIDSRWLDLKLGGIFVADRKFSKEDYKKHISYYKNNSKIKLLVATDMEGYWNPFNFYESKSLGDINTQEESFELGKEHSNILKELGFNLNFSPVVEIRNNVWKGRSFIGTKKEISQKIKGYIEGLHSKGIKATAKHYPGGNLLKDPHLLKFKVKTDKRELEMFKISFNSGVDCVMTGHPIVYGFLDSKGKQVTISKEVIGDLKKKFKGLIITDAVTMLCLRLSYFWNFKKVYPDLIRAGNDIILDTHLNSSYRKIKKRRNEIIRQAKKDSALMKRINESCKKVLVNKGYEILD